MGEVLIGVAGWDYPDWNGTVYPPAAVRDFDRLAYLARFVDVIEINTSFYRPVAPSTAESWVRRTAPFPGLRFTAKSHRSWTHDRTDSLERTVPETLRGLRPLREAGVLAAVLVQFPQSFRPSAEAFAHLEQIGEQLVGWPVVVEVRHRDWGGGEIPSFFRRRNLGWCVVDQPRVGGSTIAATERVTSEVAYVRLHGRNASDWFRPDAGRDARYDYRYRDRELEPIAAMVSRMADAAEKVIVIQNNHRRGQALANGLQMARILGREEITAPEALVDTYPDLGRFCRVRRERLF
jgi:uncharacterized protein YecE (DUF72 family)